MDTMETYHKNICDNIDDDIISEQFNREMLDEIIEIMLTISKYSSTGDITIYMGRTDQKLIALKE